MSILWQITLIESLQNVALYAIAVIGFGLVQQLAARWIPVSPKTTDAVVGLLFGATTAAAFLLPVHVGGGASTSCQTILLAVAGLITNPIGAFIALLLSVSVQLVSMLHGEGLDALGLTTSLTAAGAGMAFRQLLRLRNGTVRITYFHFPILGFVSAVLGLCALWRVQGWEIMLDSALAVVVAGISAATVTGTLLVREMRRHETERHLRESEARLAAHRETLEGTIASRTAELAASNRKLGKTVADLEVARDQAEASSRAKSQFLANMSHEIRTPMNGVLGVVELLDRSELTIKQRRYLQMIRSSGTQLLALISEILDLSKIEGGQIDFESRAFNLRQLLEETIEVFAPAAHAKGLELNTFIPAAINADVVGDTTRLSQIVTNLVGNAIKFTSSGSILVRVMSVGSRDDKSILRFEVHDTGIGIPADRQKQVFNAFVQADGSTTRKYGGTGLGLSICKQLCELMGGQIGVQSEPDKGTTFWFTLPIVPAAASQATASSFKLLSGRPVLLVSDTSVGREILTDHIVSWGLSVEVVETIAEAEHAAEVAAAKGSPFKYAVIDFSQKALEAQALGHRLAERAGPENFGAIVTTSHPSVKENEDSLVRVLVKPLNRSDLYSCLAELISGETRARDTAVNQVIGLNDDVKIAAKVLLVEDNPINQEVAIDLLEQFGCTVVGANDGREAVRRLTEDRYDIVFMDCQMPEMDGLEATKALREYERPLNRRTPVVALTANAMEDDRRQCLAADMDDYMTKPVTRRQLGAMLIKWTRATKLAVADEPAHVAATNPGSAIDTAALAALAAGSGDPARGARLIARVVRKYLETSPALVDAIRTSSNDCDTLARCAHTLKSSSAYIGALHLSELCKDLERRARGGSPDDLEELISHIESAFAETCTALHVLEEQAA